MENTNKKIIFVSMEKMIKLLLAYLPIWLQKVLLKLIDQYESKLKGVQSDLKSLGLSHAILEKKLAAYEDKASKNSQNSHKPPSTDKDNKKPKKKRTSSTRKTSKRPQGGQKGHKGQTLRMVEKPDHTEKHKITSCVSCKKDLSEQESEKIITSQVADIPPLKIEITEHISEVKTCVCGHKNDSTPPNLRPTIQYGSNLKGLSVYLSTFQHIPYKRIQSFIASLFGHRISSGTLVNWNKVAYTSLSDFESALISQLRASEVVGFDETSVKVSKQTYWLHGCFTEAYALYKVHARRGCAALDSIGVLPFFKGVAVHDFWKPYYKYPALHAQCCVHLLREFNYLSDQKHCLWASEMSILLLKMRKAKEKALKLAKKGFKKTTLGRYRRLYGDIVALGLGLHPPPVRQAGQKGRLGKGVIRCMLERLRDYESDILRFLTDFRVPFSNNISEQGLRMMKIKQKVAGCFRALAGSQHFARIRSYIVTAQKQGHNVFDSLTDLFDEQKLAKKLID